MLLSSDLLFAHGRNCSSWGPPRVNPKRPNVRAAQKIRAAQWPITATTMPRKRTNGRGGTVLKARRANLKTIIAAIAVAALSLA